MVQIHYIFLICIAFTFHIRSAQSDAYTDTFEFGVNEGKVTFSVSGSIGIWPQDKITTIPITIPSCSELSYVRVDVRNTIGPPFVKLDEDINAVVIKYRPLQHSLSTYVIVAKTVRVDCDKK